MEDQLIHHIYGEKYKEICRVEFINVIKNKCLINKQNNHCKLYLEFYQDCMKFKKNKSSK